MTSLEKVTKLKKEGSSEGDIIAKLKAEGISPMEINDALNQAKIKEAINEKSPTEGMQPSMMAEETKTSNQAPIPEEENMNQAQAPESMPQDYSPQPPAEQTQYNPQPGYSNQYGEGEQDYSPSGEAYGNEEYESYSPGYSGTDTMIEVAEQVFSEKMKEISKDIKSLIEFKTIYSSKIDDLHERVRRMERQFDKMQIAILDKVGSFGKNIQFLKKEVNMIEDSFSKMNSKI
jgi:hypothetical protein